MTSNQYNDLIRPDIRAMSPYTPIIPFEVLSEQLNRAPEDLIKLDANENPYGPSPAVFAALSALDHMRIPIYPDPQARQLRTMLSSYINVPVENILAGAGADELIDLIMRLFIQPADRIINCPPTFGMYSFDGALNGAHVINVSRNSDFSLDMDAITNAIQQHAPKLIFICSPNNPDGSIINRSTLDYLLNFDHVVVLDEAYIEFAGADSAVALALSKSNLVILRTFSKWAGLAGLRVGYGVFPSWMMSHLWKIKQPYNINVAADAAARASLTDLDTLHANVGHIISERSRLYETLLEIPYLHPYPSHANYILCRVNTYDAAHLKARLAAEYGILIRYFNKPGLTDHIRISVGKPAQTDKLIDALYNIESSLQE